MSKKIIIALLMVCLTAINLSAQVKKKQPVKKKAPTNTSTVQVKKVEYKTYKNDPYHLLEYKLSNGLTVLMSVNKAEPRIQTFIATKAGSKNDPSNHTGLAHYLEHMLFKGTDKFGTQDWAKEKPYIDQIYSLYDEYNLTKDDKKRADIYRKIDSVSGIAANYAIANEYDKLMQSIGATGTNAFTSVEQTVYVNNIPSNQLKNWVSIEAERFRMPVFRIFHTELEAVYEEKNRGLDNDDVKAYEAMMELLFKKHPYGTQTTIGTIEHLKNPSLTAIRNYYNTYYVPNNMAIILSGDFNPDEAIAAIEKQFGNWKPGVVPEFKYEAENKNPTPEIKEVVGPKAAYVILGYRLNGATTDDALKLKLMSNLLYNGSAGLVDLNLIKSQKLLTAYAGPEYFKDYSILMFYGFPSEGQKAEEARKLLEEQLEKVKKGEFDESLLAAIVNNLEVSNIQTQEDNGQRVYSIMNAFITGQDWQSYVNEISDLKKITKTELVKWANEKFTNDYAVIYKRTGTDNTTVKVEKPIITPISINREVVSPFADNIIKSKVTPIKAEFLDYSKDLSFSKLKTKPVDLIYKKNVENNRFTVYYTFEIGKDHEKRLSLALSYLDVLGTDKYTPDQLNREFYNLACTYQILPGNTRTIVVIKGLQANFEKSILLVEHVLGHIVGNNEALKGLIANEMQNRENVKKNNSFIIRTSLPTYAKYGPENPLTNVVKSKDLDKITSDELVFLIKQLPTFKHKITYYGPAELTQVSADFDRLHQCPVNLNDAGLPKFKQLTAQSNDVLFVNYDMVQVSVQWLSYSGPFNQDILKTSTYFNDYFGSGMGSIVFQTLREAKALAYSTYSYFQAPVRADENFYTLALIGTQSDKMHEAVDGMNELLKELPKSDVLFENAKRGLKSQYEANRVIREGVIDNYLSSLMLGVDHDLRKDIYNNLDAMTFEDLRVFHHKYFSDKKYNLLVVGNKDKLDMNYLSTLGTVKYINIDDLYGY
ncbi:MAG: insulinase family protein [Bacteroidota bacterium]|nr:insulinase family protein [Bacteroidota bacterium]